MSLYTIQAVSFRTKVFLSNPVWIVGIKAIQIIVALKMNSMSERKNSCTIYYSKFSNFVKNKWNLNFKKEFKKN